MTNDDVLAYIDRQEAEIQRLNDRIAELEGHIANLDLTITMWEQTARPDVAPVEG